MYEWTDEQKKTLFDEPKLKPDSEYPDWLWTDDFLTDINSINIESIEPGTDLYWKKVRETTVVKIFKNTIFWTFFSRGLKFFFSLKRLKNNITIYISRGTKNSARTNCLLFTSSSLKPTFQMFRSNRGRSL